MISGFGCQGDWVVVDVYTVIPCCWLDFVKLMKCDLFNTSFGCKGVIIQKIAIFDSELYVCLNNVDITLYS